MKVSFNYLQKQFQNTNPYFKDWRKLIISSEFTLGKFVENFEIKFAKFIGAKHCISTNTGTDALILSIKSLGAKSGDEIITVCNTFYATVGAIVACGCKPILVDCDERYQIDVEAIKKAITKKTKIIIPVHWGGASPDMKEIMKIAKKNKIKILEDACMGIGSKVYGQSPGLIGDIGAMSMHPIKTLNVMGDGGMIVTNNNRLASWIRQYKNHGMKDRNHVDFWGVNSRLQPFQAIVAKIELRKIKRIIKQRNINAKYLDKELSKVEGVIVPKRIASNIESYVLYMAQFEKRNQLKSYLIKNGIDVKIHYPIPLHLQKAYIKFKSKQKHFPIAEEQAKKILTLPVHQYLKKEQLMYTVKKIKEFYKKERST
jgi:dTDP-4-amino-4,6-dideoxygalactose transaminase